MKETNNDLSCVINKYLLKFTFCLLKNIFLKTEEPKEKEYLTINLQKINNKIIKDETKFLSFDYSIKNFENIVNFIKSQNIIFCAEILENIILKIFVKAIKVPKDETVNNYIYNNLSKIRSEDIYLKWFIKEKFQPIELKYIEDFIHNEDINFFLDSPFNYLLYRINLEKFNLIKLSGDKNNLVFKYIYNDCIPNHSFMDYVYELTRGSQNTKLDQDISVNSIMHIMNKLKNSFRENDLSLFTDLIKRFFYSVFIYYQTKNSPLINYGKEELDKNNKYLDSVPYSYNLSRAFVEGRYSNTIISPIKAEKKIEKILFEENNLREFGMYELGKALVFNNNIKCIELYRSLIRSYYLDYFILGMGIFDNYSVNELNLSYNYLNEIGVKYVERIIRKFKGLKMLNLLYNDLTNGFGSFFSVLKNLYKKNETKIEILFLNKCNLDDGAFVELGEMLKSKFCKLKKLYIIGNDYSRATNFLKKLKKNKILTEIYLGKNNLNKVDVNDINKIISNTSIKTLNIYKNKFSNFDDILRIIYRTRLIKNNENEKNLNIQLIDNSNITLQHLDISNCNKAFKSIKHIPILSKIFEETTLPILDLSKILKGELPQRFKSNSRNYKYLQELENLSKNLTEKKNKHKDIHQQIRELDVDIKRLNEDGFDYNIFNKLDKYLSEILKDKRIKLPVYLLEISRKLIDEHINKFYEINDENKEEMAEKLANYINIKWKTEELKNLKKKEELFNLIII